MARQKLKYNVAAVRELFGTDRLERQTPVATVRAIEKRIKRRLPPAVREWISYCGDLGYCSGQDHPIPLDELGEPRWLTRDTRYDAVADGYLVLMVENQGCCKWAVRLDGEDPPVVQAGRLGPG